MNIPKYIIVHHSLVSRNDNYEQFDAIDRYHKSKGWGKIGYQYLIEPNGEQKQGREDNESGAHTSQRMMNYRSIGICLSGNFDIEEPTIEQCKALYGLIRRLQRLYKIEDKDVLPHRYYAGYKSCWGTKLPNDIIGYCERRIANHEDKPQWKRELDEWAKEDIKDLPLLLQGEPYSIMALVKRKDDKIQDRLDKLEKLIKKK